MKVVPTLYNYGDIYYKTWGLQTHWFDDGIKHCIQHKSANCNYYSLQNDSKISICCDKCVFQPIYIKPLLDHLALIVQ